MCVRNLKQVTNFIKFFKREIVFTAKTYLGLFFLLYYINFCVLFKFV